MNNPIYTALLLTAIVLVIIMGVYHYKKISFKDKAKAFVYVFFATTLILFVHHYAVKQSLADASSRKDVREMFSSIHSGTTSGVTVVPILGGDYDFDDVLAKDTTFATKDTTFATKDTTFATKDTASVRDSSLTTKDTSSVRDNITSEIVKSTNKSTISVPNVKLSNKIL